MLPAHTVSVVCWLAGETEVVAAIREKMRLNRKVHREARRARKDAIFQAKQAAMKLKGEL